MRMLKYTVMCAALAAGVCWAAEEADEQARPTRGKKPNALELVRPVDEMADQAQALYVDGESKAAIAMYRQALEALAEIEEEHLVWVTSPEFAPVRTRRVLWEQTVDRIMLDDAKVYARTMTVSDTSELEKKRAERKKAAAAADAEVTAPVKLGSKGGEEMAEANADAGTDALADETFQIDEELEMVKDLIQLERLDEAVQSLVKMLRVSPENREARFLMALARVQQGRGADALVMLDDLLADDAADEPTLLLAAGAYMATGAYGKAVNALDRAMDVNPKRPDALVNMAWLLLEMHPDDTAGAEQYYRLAVKKGAGRVRELEKRLGIKQE